MTSYRVGLELFDGLAGGLERVCVCVCLCVCVCVCVGGCVYCTCVYILLFLLLST
jgi:hypothetical protein